MLDLKKFAERLEELIFDTHLQQKDFALKVDISPADICRYLQGNSMPSIKSLIKIADYFQCTTDYILGLENEKFTHCFKALPPFNQRLRQLLKHYGYSGYKFCKEATKISATSYYEWLSGEFQPNLESIVNIADFFDCTVDFVLGRSE